MGVSVRHTRVLVQDSQMDISELVIPEVPIPARILEGKVGKSKKTVKRAASTKTRKKVAVTKSVKKRKAS